MMADVILSKPLNIAAPDLMRAVYPSHSGTLYIKSRKLLGKKKWQSRYVVISQGCLYIYDDKNAKHTENAYSLTHFESVKELDTTDGEESFCFCLKNAVPTKKPLVFACDTDETREAWIEELNEVLQNIQDSGFESGGSIPARKKKYAGRGDSSVTRSRSGFLHQDHVDDQGMKGYEEISSVYLDSKMPTPVQESLRYQQAKSRTTRHNVSTNSIEQLKDLTIQAPAELPEDLYVNTLNSSNERGNEQALASATFLSVRGPATVSTMVDESVCIQDAKKCEEDADSDGTSSSGNTSPKTVYETPGLDDNDIYANTKMYEENEYFCDSKKSVKSNLRDKPSGTFLVCPGDTVRLSLCIKVPNGDTVIFRIHEKDGKLSLFEDCTIESYMFPTLDNLLRYYHIYELPSKNSKVTLKKGYNSFR